MVKHYILNKDITISRVKYASSTEFNIKTIDKVEYLMDGCFPICTLKCALESDIGKIVERLY